VADKELEEVGELYPLAGRSVKGSIRWNSKRFFIYRKTEFRMGLTRPEAGVYI